MSNIFERKIEKDNDLPEKYNFVWNQFLEFYSKKYRSLKFEKIKGNEKGVFYLCVRPLRDAAGTATLASIIVLSESRIKCRVGESLNERILSSPDQFVDILLYLMDSQYIQTQLKIMMEINENGPFVGFVLDCAPYEISPTSVKFFLTKTETDKFLKIANSDESEECKSSKESTCIIGYIKDNIYPKTSLRFKTNTYEYKYILFQGFLFDFKSVRKNKEGKLVLTGSYRRTTRI